MALGQKQEISLKKIGTFYPLPPPAPSCTALEGGGEGQREQGNRGLWQARVGAGEQSWRNLERPVTG